MEAEPSQERLHVRLTQADKAYIEDVSYRVAFLGDQQSILETALGDLAAKNGGHYDLERHRRGENVELLVID